MRDNRVSVLVGTQLDLCQVHDSQLKPLVYKSKPYSCSGPASLQERRTEARRLPPLRGHRCRLPAPARQSTAQVCKGHLLLKSCAEQRRSSGRDLAALNLSGRLAGHDCWMCRCPPHKRKGTCHERQGWQRRNCGIYITRSPRFCVDVRVSLHLSGAGKVSFASCHVASTMPQPYLRNCVGCRRHGILLW